MTSSRLRRPERERGAQSRYRHRWREARRLHRPRAGV